MSSTTPAAADADELNRVQLTIAYLAYRFGQLMRGRQVRGVAVRENGTETGVHTVVTGDLDELQALLAPPGLAIQPAPAG